MKTFANPILNIFCVNGWGKFSSVFVWKNKTDVFFTSRIFMESVMRTNFFTTVHAAYMVMYQKVRLYFLSKAAVQTNIEIVLLFNANQRRHCCVLFGILVKFVTNRPWNEFNFQTKHRVELLNYYFFLNKYILKCTAIPIVNNTRTATWKLVKSTESITCFTLLERHEF